LKIIYTDPINRVNFYEMNIKKKKKKKKNHKLGVEGVSEDLNTMGLQYISSTQ
jgi:hypothetical protein